MDKLYSTLKRKHVVVLPKIVYNSSITYGEKSLAGLIALPAFRPKLL